MYLLRRLQQWPLSIKQGHMCRKQLVTCAHIMYICNILSVYPYILAHKNISKIYNTHSIWWSVHLGFWIIRSARPWKHEGSFLSANDRGHPPWSGNHIRCLSWIPFCGRGRWEKEREREGEIEGGREREKVRGRGRDEEREWEWKIYFPFQMEVRCSLGVRVGLTLAMSYQTVSPSSCGLRRWTPSLNRRSSMCHVENLTH